MATTKKTATKLTSEGSAKRETFTDEEQAAMKERAQEQKTAARRGARASKAGGETDVLSKIAEMPMADRAMAERIHAVSSSRGTRPWASATTRSSMTVPCGRPPSP